MRSNPGLGRIVGGGSPSLPPSLRPPHLQNVPVDDGPPRVLHHLSPVLELCALAAVAHDDAADGVGSADPVVVAHSQLQLHPLRVRAAQFVVGGREA